VELIRREIPVKSRSDVFRVYLSYDWHVGPPGCDYDLLESQVKTILNDDHGYCILGGDLNDAIAKHDRRHDSANIDPRFQEPNNVVGSQYRYISNIVKPLADEKKVLGVLFGNHERRYSLETDYDITRMLSQTHGIPYGGFSAVFYLRFKRGQTSRQLLIHAIHGHRGGTTKGGKANALENQASNVEGPDIFIRGHGHQKLLMPDEQVGVRADGGELREYKRKVWKGSSGAYLRILTAGVTSYAEQAEYKSTDLGCIYAEVEPFAYNRHNGKKSTKMKVELRDLQ
jgi:hypothetical protein